MPAGWGRVWGRYWGGHPRSDAEVTRADASVVHPLTARPGVAVTRAELHAIGPQARPPAAVAAAHALVFAPQPRPPVAVAAAEGLVLWSRPRRRGYAYAQLL